MRLFAAIVLLLPVYALAQDAPKQDAPKQDAPKKAPMPEPKNLKILTGQTGPQLMETMRNISVALGVRCDHCHVRGDFASDENPKKETARISILPKPAATPAPAINMTKTQPLLVHPPAAVPAAPVIITSKPLAPFDAIPRPLCWAVLGISALIFLIQIWNYVVS